MRVTYLVNGNGLSPELGGSVVRTANVAKRLAAAGDDVRLITTPGGLAATRRLGLSVPSTVLRASVFAKHERGMLSRLFSYVISSAHGVLASRSQPKADWIYSDSDYPCDVLPAIALQRAGRGRWVAMVHHILKNDASSRSLSGLLKYRLQRSMHKLIAKHADVVFAYATEAGDQVASEIAALGANHEIIHRVHNGFDGAELQSIQPAAERFDACLIGGLRPGKGLHEIVPIWRAVCDERPSSLALIGGIVDSNRALLESEIAKAGLSDYIHLLGPRSHAEAISILKATTIMISPSLEEGWGIAVCEALACGVPVVSYDLPAYRSLFSDGMLRAPVGDRAGFANLVCRVLRDPGVRDELAARAPAAVAAYDWNTVAAREAELLGALGT